MKITFGNKKLEKLANDQRKCQWACDLDGPYRLVFKPMEKPIPTNKDGQALWSEIKGVEIIEVTNYHGK